ncbi:HAD-IIA family hydrolase [Kineosporiaceae bacterium B12]|nr:HAD-IIA family hydrolase [Kineococcus rubinsiae]
MLDDHDALLLDLDGVVYIGPDAVPHAAAALDAARGAGLQLAYVTNNASRPPSAVAEHLSELGVPATAVDVVNSAQAAATHLAATLPAGSPVLLVGGAGLREALEEAGLRPVTTLADAPVAVVQGFSPDLGWKQLSQATQAVRSGLPWTATNLDATVPTPGGPAPGNGLLVHVVAEAAGRRPDAVCGKPERALFDVAVQRLGASAAMVVGDRLDTDLQGAVAADLPGLLVLTGVTGVAELLAARPGERPVFVAHDLRGTADVHPGVTVETDAAGGLVARCRAAAVRVEGGTASVAADDAGPDGLDLLRAAAEAVWQARDAGTTVDVSRLTAEVAAGLVTAAPGDSGGDVVARR